MSTASAPTTPALAALRPVVILVASYLTLSVVTIGAAIILRNNASLVNTAVWIRGSIVAITAALMLRFAIGASRGDSRHLLRLRIVSAVMVLAIAAILLLIPGDFPMWMKIEQATCGVILLVVVILANGKRVRSAFATVPGTQSIASH